MILSDDEREYVDLVCDRFRKCIQFGVFEGIDEARLDAWLGCLRNVGVELLSAYLLDNLCFRSKKQFASLLARLFEGLPSISSVGNVKVLDIVTKEFKNETGPGRKILIAPVIGDHEPPTKSGPYVLRLAQRQFAINSDWLAWPHQIIGMLTSTEEIFFIDDFCGSGNQFVTFLRGIGFDEMLTKKPGLSVTYLVATIHDTAIGHISNLYPQIKLRWAERLADDSALFSKAGFLRYDIKGFSEKIAEQYHVACQALELPVTGKLANGYGDLALAYAFAHATPNNTLPIYWMATRKLTPLLDR